MKNVALIFGGGSSEHKISALSKDYLVQNISKSDYNVKEFELSSDFNFSSEKKDYELKADRLVSSEDDFPFDYIIPCIHGYPSESGDFQSLLDAYSIPYLGCNSEASKMCFNKAVTKLWLEHFKIDTTPFISVLEGEEKEANEFLNKHGQVFVKASKQGSSIGCYLAKSQEELKSAISNAFKLSDFVIIEKFLTPRELEVAAFEYEGKVHVTRPAEINCPDGLYDYQEKYSKDSKTTTSTVAELNDDMIKKINEISLKVFKCLNLKDLSRIDFFLDHGKLYVNEVNTFPGLTPISLFPKMMENYGVPFKSFISERIDKAIVDVQRRR